jgi:phytoene synthase
VAGVLTDAGLSAGDAYASCAAIATRSGSSFLQAFRLLPDERRRGLEALYAFCRLVDDAADEATDPAAALAGWRAELALVFAGTPRHPVGVALADTVRRFGIRRQHLDDVVTGVEMDLERRRYETFEELRHYCHHVASAVGLATVPILGCRGAASERYAESLGVALQLTNILRDLAEDAERGRIYLPLEDLRRFGYGERELLTHTRGDAFRALMAFECARAAALYREARAGLAPEDRRALAPAEGMRLVYQRLLARIRRRPEAVFGPRLGVSRGEKIACVATAWVRSRIGGRS